MGKEAITKGKSLITGLGMKQKTMQKSFAQKNHPWKKNAICFNQLKPIMKPVKTTLDKIQKLRTDYLHSLPQFQELFIELMIGDAEFYSLQTRTQPMGYAIKTRGGVLLEFYIAGPYIPESKRFFRQLISDLSITDIYCKSFDSLLLCNCLESLLPYSVIGILYRDYAHPLIESDPGISMRRACQSSVALLDAQDDSIKELFETREQLTGFIENEHVFEFYRGHALVGCGMAVRTIPGWNYYDLGVWVQPSERGNGIGAQILLSLRDFALKNNMKASCGCAADNHASQRAIEKSGYVSKYRMIHFETRETIKHTNR
ncbi:GNAT family N-acetyltransferase [Maribellus luteus]|uniref:GNAT family N-acetyltransferase n=1 Tax=Maribellus luteus TaxID=2305463 RepID=A0A399T195_9BACT|nr:GNAT family N-acetyltransferase [Maribellus luteus]RIJ47921.1 GNAT family N-acetyltransferase [Maribellus luteus]